MAEQIIDEYRIISTKLLVKAIKEANNSSERFCFILGSGASVSSNIPAGGDLERKWMEELENDPGLEEIHATADKLRKCKHLEYDFREIEKVWQDEKNRETPLPSKYYFDIYKLRFFPNHRNGYHYLEKIMADAKPSFGYHPLALMLTDKSVNNLVITTNFDSLVEDALFMYTNSKPLVINHELLADFAGDPNIKRPIIAKVHRGIFFDPINRSEETAELKEKWHDVLVSVFQNYTPIVIGYGGGDNSLMELLSDKNVKMKNGIYWCYVEEYGLPNKNILKLVQQKKGYLVCTAGFDATMLAIGNALYPDKIGVHETEQYLNDRTNTQIENYEKEYKKLTKYEEKNNTIYTEKGMPPSEDEFRKEIEKIATRGTLSENERQKSNKMTAWDYHRQGSRFRDLGQYENAVISFSNAIEKQPDIAMFYNDRGCVYSHLHKHEEAISDYNKAIELKPDYSPAYNNRGLVYNNLGEYEKALSDLNKAIELMPDDSLAYNNRGFTYDHYGRYDDAISDYNKAIELMPDDSLAYNNRGSAYNDLGEYEKALSDLSKAISIKPDYPNPYRHSGTTWKKQGDFKKALKFYTKAIELNSKYKEAYLDRAELYRLMGDETKAAEDEAIAAKL